jgi:hypothetical protein
MSEIKNKAAKKLMQQAQDFLQENDYPKTICYATTALEVILYKIDTEGDPRINSLPQGLKSNFLYEITRCSYLNIDVEQYVRYRKMAGYWEVPVPIQENFPYPDFPPNPKSGAFSMQTPRIYYERKHAEVSLQYCRETIIHIEETFERLNKPKTE